MTEKGYVTEISGEYAKVSILKTSACGENCASCKGGCVPTERIMTVKNPISAKVGERVIIEMPEKNVLTAAFLVYIMPLVVFLFVYLISGSLHGLTKIIISLLALAAYFFLLKLFDLKNKDKYTAEITGVC